MPPTCSIVIPVYNDPGGYLEGALESVTRQTLSTWEAIVVDDGSAEPTAAAEVARLGDPRVRLITHERNRGLAAARNTGTRAAESDVIVLLDADDMLEPMFVERVTPFLAPGSKFNLVVSDSTLFGGYEGIMRHGNGRREAVAEYEPAELISLLRYQWIPAGGTAFRRSLWEAVGGYCEDDALRVGNEDFEFLVGAVEAGLCPVYIAEPLYRYRTGHASMMSGLRLNLWKTHRFIYRRHRAIYDRHGMGNAFLADGYIRSAESVRSIGRRRQAVRLALRGLRHQPFRLDGAAVIGRSLLPTRVHELLRSARSSIEGARS